MAYRIEDLIMKDKLKTLNEIKETLDELLGQFQTGELVGFKLEKDLKYIKEKIIILENLH